MRRNHRQDEYCRPFQSAGGKLPVRWASHWDDAVSKKVRRQMRERSCRDRRFLSTAVPVHESTGRARFPILSGRRPSRNLFRRRWTTTSAARRHACDGEMARPSQRIPDRRPATPGWKFAYSWDVQSHEPRAHLKPKTALSDHPLRGANRGIIEPRTFCRWKSPPIRDRKPSTACRRLRHATCHPGKTSSPA